MVCAVLSADDEFLAESRTLQSNHIGRAHVKWAVRPLRLPVTRWIVETRSPPGPYLDSSAVYSFLKPRPGEIEYDGPSTPDGAIVDGVPGAFLPPAPVIAHDGSRYLGSQNASSREVRFGPLSGIDVLP